MISVNTEADHDSLNLGFSNMGVKKNCKKRSFRVKHINVNISGINKVKRPLIYPGCP